MVYGLLHSAHKNFLIVSVSPPTLVAFNGFSSATGSACKFISTIWNTNSRRNGDLASEDLSRLSQIAADVLFKHSWKRLLLSHKRTFVGGVEEFSKVV